MDYSEQIENLTGELNDISISLDRIHTEMETTNVYLKEIAMCAHEMTQGKGFFPSKK